MISPRTHGARDWWWHSYYVFTAPRSHNWDQRQNQPCVPTVKTSTRWEREGLWEWGDVKMDVMCGFHHPNPQFWVNSPHLQHSSSSTIDLQSNINSRIAVYTNMFLWSYFFTDLRIIWFPTLPLQLGGLYLHSTWSKGLLNAVCHSSTPFHFILSNKYKPSWS